MSVLTWRHGALGAGVGADRIQSSDSGTPRGWPGEGRRGNEVGSSAPLTLMLGVAFIVLPVTVLVLMLPTWEQRAVDAQDAARTAARALVTADTWDDGVAAAEEAVSQLAAGDGLAPGDVSVGLSGSLGPGGSVTAAVTVLVPVGDVPGLGVVGTLHYTASSTEHVDSYRESAT